MRLESRQVLARLQQQHCIRVRSLSDLKLCLERAVTVNYRSLGYIQCGEANSRGSIVSNFHSSAKPSRNFLGRISRFLRCFGLIETPAPDQKSETALEREYKTSIRKSIYNTYSARGRETPPVHK